MIEQEFKFLISLEEYNILLAYFSNYTSNKKLLKQNNHYFDTTSHAYRKQCYTIKIREYLTDHKPLKLFIKHSKKSSYPNLHINKEYTIPLSAQTFERSLFLAHNNILDYPNIISYIQEIAFYHTPLIYFGFLSTKRKQFFDDSIKICLDTNTYLNQTDYEIEFEGHDPSKLLNYYQFLFDKFSLSPPFSHSKSSRFYRQLK